MVKLGRPSEFRNINLKQAEKLVKEGFTDKQLANFFDVSEVTLNAWKEKHPTFLKSLIDWKKNADEKVEQSLYKRAIGYEYDEITYEKTKAGGLGIGISKGEVDSIKHIDCYKTKITTKQVIPDVLAQIFWLKNRQPDKWKDKTDIEHTLPEHLLEKYKEIPIHELISKLNGLIGNPAKP